MACGESEKYAPQLLQKLQEAPEAGSVLDELKAWSWGTPGGAVEKKMSRE